MFICRRSCRHYHPQQETLGLAGCHRGDVGRTDKKATGCLWRARFLASAAHVDGNADADSVADFRRNQHSKELHNWAAYTSIDM